jgi:phospholipase C
VGHGSSESRGQTHGATHAIVSGKVVNGSVIANIDPTGDECSTGKTIQMAGPSIGDLLTAKGITWGWFSGDWTPAGVSNGIATCISQEDPHNTPSNISPPH